MKHTPDPCFYCSFPDEWPKIIEAAMVGWKENGKLRHEMKKLYLKDGTYYTAEGQGPYSHIRHEHFKQLYLQGKYMTENNNNKVVIKPNDQTLFEELKKENAILRDSREFWKDQYFKEQNSSTRYLQILEEKTKQLNDRNDDMYKLNIELSRLKSSIDSLYKSANIKS